MALTSPIPHSMWQGLTKKSDHLVSVTSSTAVGSATPYNSRHNTHTTVLIGTCNVASRTANSSRVSVAGTTPVSAWPCAISTNAASSPANGTSSPRCTPPQRVTSTRRALEYCANADSWSGASTTGRGSVRIWVHRFASCVWGGGCDGEQPSSLHHRPVQSVSYLQCVSAQSCFGSIVGQCKHKVGNSFAA